MKRWKRVGKFLQQNWRVAATGHSWRERVNSFAGGAGDYHLWPKRLWWWLYKVSCGKSGANV